MTNGRLLASGLLLAALAAGPSGAAALQRRQTDRQQSPRLVAFPTEEPKAEEPAATTPATPETVTPEAPRPSLDPRRAPRGAVAAVVPPSPRVVSRSAMARRGGEFVAQPAVSTGVSINSGYGPRVHPISKEYRMHTGVDIKASYGQSVGASMGGTVRFAGPRAGYGNLVVVDHGNGLTTFYAHLSQIGVAVGQPVATGEVLGYAGSTGNSTGPHLHYELRANGHPVNPFSTVTVDGTLLLVDGHTLRPGSADAPGFALPAAPGGTAISIDWDADAADAKPDAAKPEHRMKVDLE